MTNGIQLFNAIGNIDDDIAANAIEAAQHKLKPAKLRVMLMIAAAAALTLFVGFAAVYKSNVELNGEPVFEYNIKIHDEAACPSIGELTEMGAYDIHDYDPNLREYEIKDIDPRDITKKYNVALLAGENFSRADLKGYSTADRDAEEYRELFLSKTRVVEAENYCDDGMYGSYVNFNYWLADDRLDIPVYFRVVCMTGDYNASLTHKFTSIKPDGSDFGVIGLNNNEKALIHQSDNDGGSSMTSYATFTYDGILYDIFAHTDMNGMEQILKDLGVL